MEWVKKHVETITILGTFAVCFWQLNEKMNENFNVMQKEMSHIEKEVAIIKTVMIMRNILSNELATHEEVK